LDLKNAFQAPEQPHLLTAGCEPGTVQAGPGGAGPLAAVALALCKVKKAPTAAAAE